MSAGSGDDVVLAATGAFTNQAGASAVSVSGGGRWLIYSSAPGADAFGGLNSDNTAVWNTAAGASVSASGNRYVFAYQPTLTVTTTSDSKTYGTDATSQIQADYTISGVEAGVAGAFLGDTASAVYSGAPSLASAGAGASANVAGGPYTISASLGTLTAADGYAIQFANMGKLTVNPATLTWSVASASFTYGSSPTLGSATLSGVVAGDQGDVSGVVGVFTTGGSAVTLSAANIGTYVEEVTGLTGSAASNYVLAPTGDTTGVLTINLAAPSNPVTPQIPFEPANGANANIFNSSAHTCVGGGPVSCSADARSSSQSDAGSKSGAPVNAPYPGNLSGWGDIRFESGSNP